jgi:hypothetical protein
MKITKSTAKKAQDAARLEKQRIMGQSKKNLSSKEKNRIKELNGIISDAQAVIDGN